MLHKLRFQIQRNFFYKTILGILKPRKKRKERIKIKSPLTSLNKNNFLFFILIFLPVILFLSFQFFVFSEKLNFRKTEFSQVQDKANTSEEINTVFFKFNRLDNNYVSLEPIIFLSVDSSLMQAKLLAIDTVFLISEKNKVRLSDFFQDLQYKNTNFPIDILIEEIEKKYAIRIDRYFIQFEDSDIFEQVSPQDLNKTLSNSEEKRKNLSENVKSFQSFFKDFSGFWGNYNFNNKVKSLNLNIFSNLAHSEFKKISNGINNYNLRSEVIFPNESDFLPDIFPLSAISNSQEDEIKIKNLLVNSKILTERAQVEIFNGTDISGLANRVGNELSIQGIKVIRTGNSQEHNNKTKIIVISDEIEKFKQTLQSIILTLGNKIDIITVKEYVGNYTGNILIFLE